MIEELQKLSEKFENISEIFELRNKKITMEDFCSIVGTIDLISVMFFNYENLLYEIDNNIDIQEEEISKENKCIFYKITVISNNKRYSFIKQTSIDDQNLINLENSNEINSTFYFEDYQKKNIADNLDDKILKYLSNNKDKDFKELILNLKENKEEEIFKYSSLQSIEDLNQCLNSMKIFYKIKFQFEKLYYFDLVDRIFLSKNFCEIILLEKNTGKYYKFKCKYRKIKENTYIYTEIEFKKEVQKKEKIVYYWE